MHGVIAISLSVLIELISFPVLADQYDCVFESNGKALKNCMIDFAIPAKQHCVAAISAKIEGNCAATKNSGSEDVWCAFYPPSSNNSKIIEQLTKNPKILPRGFLAFGSASKISGKPDIFVAYREKAISPTIDGHCFHR